MADTDTNWFLKGGEMGELIREKQWSETPLGPIQKWPKNLKIAAQIMSGAKGAIGIYWGPELNLLYNNAWRELIGEKHPDALGKPARDVFPEIWETIGPAFDSVLKTGRPLRSKISFCGWSETAGPPKMPGSTIISILFLLKTVRLRASLI